MSNSSFFALTVPHCRTFSFFSFFSFVLFFVFFVVFLFFVFLDHFAWPNWFLRQFWGKSCVFGSRVGSQRRPPSFIRRTTKKQTINVPTVNFLVQWKAFSEGQSLSSQASKELTWLLGDEHCSAAETAWTVYKQKVRKAFGWGVHTNKSCTSRAI